MNRFARAAACPALILALVMTALPPAAAQRALQPGLASPSGSYLAGRRAMNDLHTTEAARYFGDAALSDPGNPLIVLKSFELLIADGQIDRAAGMLPRVLALDPENQLAALLQGTVALKGRRYDSAVQHLAPVAPDAFIGITATIVRAWALVGSGQLSEALGVLDTISRPGLEEFLVFHRALMADVAGERDLALQLSADAYTAEPGVARIVETYARVLANASRFDEARQVLEAFAGEGLQDPAVTALGETLARDVRPGKLASTVQSGAAEMFYSIGVALAQDDSVDVSIVFLRLGLYLDPGADHMTLALGEAFSRSRQYAVANRLFAGIDMASPHKPLATIYLSQNLDAMGEDEAAIGGLRALAERRPDDLIVVAALGQLLRYNERYEEAALVFTRALELSGPDAPASWQYFYGRGISYERTGQWELAEPDFLKALELNPGDPQVLNYLGYSWVDQGLYLERALDMIKEAVEWDPSDGYVVDSLGWAYYRLGRLEEAVQTLEQAVQLRPNDPELNDHLGDAYWSVGRKLEARFQWTIARDVDDTGRVRERAEKKLVSGLDG